MVACLNLISRLLSNFLIMSQLFVLMILEQLLALVAMTQLLERLLQSKVLKIHISKSFGWVGIILKVVGSLHQIQVLQ